MKIGPDCKIQDENVVHMVEKVVPVEATTAQNTGANVGAPSATATSPQAAQAAFSFPLPGAPGAVPGPNVVIRAVQFGFEPPQGILPHAAPSASPLPSGASSATNPASPNPVSSNAAGDAPRNPAIEQMLASANQAVSQLLQGFGLAPPATNASAQSAANGNASATGTSGAQASTGAPPQNVPTAAPSTGALPAGQMNFLQAFAPPNPTQIANALAHAMEGLETSVCAQFEAHITTLASDVLASQDSFFAAGTLPDRTYEIHILRSPGTAQNAAQTSVPPPTVQALWMRFVALQRRWLAIVESIEANDASFGTGESVQQSPARTLTGPVLASPSTAQNTLPKLILPLAHPLRHLLEHWIPQVCMQIGSISAQLGPLLSHHHHTHFHQQASHSHTHPHSHHPRTQNTAQQATQGQTNGTAAPNSTNNPMAQNPSASSNLRNIPLSSPAATSSTNAQNANFPHGATQTSSTPISQQQNQQQTQTTSTTEARTNAEVKEGAKKLGSTTAPESSSSASSSSQSSSNSTGDAASQAETSLTPNAASSVSTSTFPATTISTYGLSSEEMLEQWDAIVDQDEERQKARRMNQRPFSDAYDAGSPPDGTEKHAGKKQHQSHAQTRNESEALLKSLMETAEEAIPGAASSGLPLTHTPIPQPLLASFQHRLTRMIQSTVEEDEDWLEMQRSRADEIARRYPNLSRVMSKKD